MDEKEIRTFGECECCGNEVTDDHEEYYITEDGMVFCSVDCLIEYFHIEKIEV